MTPEQFRTFAHPLREPMVLLTGEGLILAGNRAIEEWVGVGPQGLQGKAVSDIVADAPDEVARYLRHCSRSRQLVLGALMLHGRDGTTACRSEGTLLRPRTPNQDAALLLRLVPRDRAVGQFVALNLRIEELGREIQRRRRAEQDAREQAERLRTTLASIGDGVIATDTEACVTNMNAVAESLTGWTNAEAKGQPLETVFRIVNEETRQLVENPARRALKHGVVVGLANHTLLVARDGTERPIDDSAAPIWCKEGQPVGCVLVFRDVSERRRLERETQSRLLAARLLASIVESSADAILSTSLDSIVQSWNAGAERLFGYTAEQAVGRHISLIIPPDRLDEEARIIAALKAGQRVEPYETVRQRSNGERFVVSLTASPVWGEDGQVVGASKIVRDLSDLRRAEERGRALMSEAVEADTKFRAFFEQGALFAGIMHTDGTILEPNRLSLEACGYTREQVVGKYFWDCPWWNRSPALMDRIKAAWRQAAAGEMYRAELAYYVADGSERMVDFILLPVKDESGRVKFLAPTGTDITDKKRAEQELAEALRFYHSSIDALSSHIAILDDRGVILEVNHQWRRFAEDNQFAGFDCGVGTNYIEVCEASPGACADDGAVVRGLKDVLAGRADLFETEYPCHSPTDERWFLMRVTPFKSPGPVRVVVSHENVTARRQAEDALRQADRRKDEFLATLAHELRNPLAPVRNAVHVLRLKAPPVPELQWATGVIDRQVRQMTRLVDDLMDLSRISQGKLVLKPESTDLERILLSAIETSRPIIDQQRHELTVTLPPEPIRLEADLTRLAQVFSNLLNNAAKYTDPGGRITVSAERQDSDVVVSVSDTGIGIPTGSLRSIFEVFSQVESALSRTQGGLGIGLALVKRLVELHGGRIEARSDGPDRGSAFLVRLPVHIEQTAARAASHEEARMLASTSLRILIVDDNQDAAESIAMMLDLLGNQTRTAHDGERAVQIAGEFRPDVVLLDIGLPRLNGYDACRRIREQPWGRSMILIAVTGWGQDDDRRKSKEAGFDRHMVKPVDPEDLLTELHSIYQTVTPPRTPGP